MHRAVSKAAIELVRISIVAALGGGDGYAVTADSFAEEGCVVKVVAEGVVALEAGEECSVEGESTVCPVVVGAVCTACAGCAAAHAF